MQYNKKIIIQNQSKNTLRMNGYLDCDVALELSGHIF